MIQRGKIPRSRLYNVAVAIRRAELARVRDRLVGENFSFRENFLYCL